MRIILAIDVIDGKCVRLTKGDYSTRKTYDSDPLEVAKQAEYNGIKYLHLVDLNGAARGKPLNLSLIEKLTSKTSLKIDFGGGIKTTEDLGRAFDYGATQVTGGSVAVHNPDLFLSWLSLFGADKIILGADSSGRIISTDGWKKSSGLEVLGFIKDYAEKGVKYTICTDIEKDGMLQGPSLQLYREILQSAPINLIASGGISSIKDIDDLEKTGCDGAIIGKAFYEGIITLKELGKRC
jgi:phosphoribosylformimino-5-aminoimidazole carboxamide ribotide isomerase